MGPEPLIQAVWEDLNRDLLYLALLHLSVVTFAGSILFARGVIPSLVNFTGHASERVYRLRVPVYALAVLSGLSALFMAYMWISNLGFAFDFYDHTYY
jgi:hypothetical protein